MDFLSSVIVIGILCFIIGALIGAIVTRRFSATEQENRDLEKHLHDKQDELKSYKNEVTAHFVKTASMLQNLTESYREMHNHLAENANKLTQTGYDPIIDKIPKPKNINQPKESDTLSPPLDYAPKTTPYDKGALTDDYDLEKVSLNEETMLNHPEEVNHKEEAVNKN